MSTVGPPLPQTEVKIVAPGGADPLSIGSLGELCVRDYLVMTGYFDNVEGTAAARTFIRARSRKSCSRTRQ